MKKLWRILAGAALALALAACSCAPSGPDPSDSEKDRADGVTWEEVPDIEPEDENQTGTPADTAGAHYGVLIPVAEETILTLNGIRLQGAQHPNGADKGTRTKEIDCEFKLDETIFFRLDTDYSDWDSGKVLAYAVRTRALEDYDYMTLQDIIDESAFTLVFSAQDAEGWNGRTVIDGDSFEEGGYDILFMADNAMAYIVRVQLQGYAELSTEEEGEGIPEEDPGLPIEEGAGDEETTEAGIE